jgi:hypothetical protein
VGAGRREEVEVEEAEARGIEAGKAEEDKRMMSGGRRAGEGGSITFKES